MKTGKIMLSAAALLLSGVAMTAVAQAKEMKSGHMASEPALLQEWTGPYEGVPPWDKVKVAQFPAAFQAAMQASKAEFEAMLAKPEAITFDNTITASELSGEKIGRLFSIWGVHSSNLSNPEVRKIQAEWEPKVSAFFSELSLDARYFQRVKYLYDQRDNLGLDAKQMRLLERTYDGLVRNGAMLDAGKKAQVISIETDLAKKFSAFSEKVLADEETFILITDAADLAGLPESYVAAIQAAAKAKGQAGWAVVNTRSAVQPFLENSTRRDLREKVWRAFTMRGDNQNANDTNDTIAEILKLRQQRAEILGFPTHAHYRMADTMAKDPNKAMDLMMKVWPAAAARVKEEVADMQAIANADNITIAPWDYRFYAEKVRKAKYDLDQEAVKPYFQLDNMVAAMFDAAGKLYGMSFTENTGTVPVFEPKVRTFEVKRDGKVVGLFYLDNFARAGKRSGAWMTTYRSQHKLGGKNDIVLASNNNNFVPGADGVPTLISIDDASTLFHEFGHAIHYLNYDITWPGLGGTPRDFVEYPSQVNENWLLTPYVLNTYAKHYKTGEPIPAALVEKIRASDTFNQGFSTVEYLSSAILDMKLHNRSEPVTDPRAFERDTLAEIGMPKEMAMRHRLPQFNHLFADDGYSAGYYSYLWSETMDADTWAAFTEKGDVWDKETAERFRSMLLATGNETDRIEAYRAFRGRDPDVKYIMKKRGFPTGE
ncbi:MAG TPA: M3 family metallopeptidase [Sphingorhabdus sp.]|uniref:M3 family metallopeptidase n=1 Tax=Sphingorhabdus sp. TaxID=1902408 RepID=UPI002C876AC8|nr:M3 family metallopeptidase [Sphingorhabdus sp.]HQS12603.1 M3 family metallopeptidase [Sphingorhabdus sp.]HQS80561.1 M3 family metallopeptidase [Sphingorhabdus sp.]